MFIKNVKKSKLGIIVMSLLMVVLLLAGCTGTELKSEDVELETGKLILRVNPEIEVEYDQKGFVTKLVGKNEDGNKILSEYDNYVGKKSNIVVRELIEKIHDAGYFISDVDGSYRNINIQFEPGSILPNPNFPNEITDEIKDLIANLDINSDIVGISPSDYDSDYITEAKAKEIALAHAGLKESEIKYIKVKMDMDDDNMEWEIDFTKDNLEYEYELDAKTGKITDIDIDKKETTTKAQTTKAPEKPNSSSNGSSDKEKADYISKDKAIEIALNHAGVSRSNVAKFDDVDFEWDDGYAKYEIEFDTADAEYEFKIDAKTGKILKYKKDVKSKSKKQSSGKGSQDNKAEYISKDKAIETALSHAGASKNNAVFDDVEFDWEDGRPIYEIEFDAGEYEYKYEIDAITGKILKWDMDD